MPAALTARKLETLKPGKKRREIPDGYLPGAYHVIQPSGSRGWIVRYRFHRRPRKLTIGRYPAIDLKTARELAAKALREVAEGRDPGREKARRRAGPVKDSSVDYLVNQFVAKQCALHYRPGPAKEAERILRKHVLPKWRGWAVSEITRSDVRDLVEPMAKTPVMANRTYKIVRRLFSWAVEHGDLGIAASPCTGMRAPFKEEERERVLSDPELLLIWKAAGALGGPGGLLVKLLMLTGQRRSEVAGMAWDELDLEQGVWALPRGRVKNDRAHVVPLAAAVVDLLQATPRLGPCVVSPTGEVPTKDFAQTKRAIDALLPADMPHWTFHDLRRTWATGLARLRAADLPVIERALNHVSGAFRGVVGIYQRHDFQIEVRAAMEAWANHVLALGAGGRVVSLRRKAR
jgi:integrase